MPNDPKTAKRPRGRPRAYDPDIALDQARDEFWQGGYSGTSLDELAAATGMNRPSLYGAFGAKHDLYLNTLQRYTNDAVVLMHQALDPRVPLATGLRRVYDGALVMYFPNGQVARGCLLIGTAATESVRDEAIRQRLGGALLAFDKAFEARFRTARDNGELPEGSDPLVLARLASAILHSLAVRARAGDSRAVLSATAKAGVALLCGTGRPG